MVARPGGGIITYCVKNQIPLIALYDENDSNEILELADKIEELNIGVKQNVKDPFYNPFTSNSNYEKLDIKSNGFKQTANYLNKLLK